MTPLRRPGPTAGATREAVVATARRQIATTATLDLHAIAQELGIGRSTLYRWFGSSHVLLGEALWAMTRDELARAQRCAAGEGKGASHVAAVAAGFIRGIGGYRPVLGLLRHDPATAASVLITPGGRVQLRLIAAVETMILREPRYAPAMPPRQLATLVVQMGMAHLLSAALSRWPPDVEETVQAARALLLVERDGRGRLTRAPR